MLKERQHANNHVGQNQTILGLKSLMVMPNCFSLDGQNQTILGLKCIQEQSK